MMQALETEIHNRFDNKINTPKITKLQFENVAPQCDKIFACLSTKGDLLFYIFEAPKSRDTNPGFC